ncbi:MAG: RNA methyltransferase, partial [Deinococcus sp.]|nr:RNA methyltransferase [Deinococcus sp.]
MWIYGRNPVLEALKEGGATRLLVARGVESWLIAELKKLDAEYQLVPRIELDQLLCTTHHQGIAAEVEEFAYAEPEAPFRLAKSRAEAPLLVLLDGISDPRNYGAIIRSALALGAHGVITEERRSAPLSPLVLKASAGALRKIPLVRVKNLPRYMEDLKKQNIWIYGAAGGAERDIGELDYNRALALLVEQSPSPVVLGQAENSQITGRVVVEEGAVVKDSTVLG